MPKPDYDRITPIGALAMVAGLASAIVSALLLGTNPALAEKPNNEAFTATTAITLPQNQVVRSFDIGFVDPGLGLYLLADRTNSAIDAVETPSNTVFQLGVGQFAGAGPTPDVSGPNGVITVGPNEIWIGDFDTAKGGEVRVLDPFTNTITQTIVTGGTKRADELCYDPNDNLVLIANDAEPLPPSGTGPYVSFISTQGTNAYTVVGKITMDGTNGAPLATNGIEQCQWSPKTGMFYLNIPEVNGSGSDTVPGAVLVISPETMQIVRTFTIPLGVCAGPQGMALGPENQILLGCNNPNKTVPSTVVINARSGAVMRVLANEDGSDEVWYNPGDGHYFLARSGGADASQRLGVVDAQSGSEDTSPITGDKPGGGAHSVAADPVSNHVYVPIGNNAGGNVCTAAGGSNLVGCIAVFTAPNNDKPRGHVFAQRD